MGAALVCVVAAGLDVYSPFRASGSYPSGPVSAHPWRGVATSYPDGDETFTPYGLPSSVECGSTKGTRDYLDVTEGCLSAVPVGSYARGQITPTADGYFRAVALGHDAGVANPTKWTDQTIEYRFDYAAQAGDIGNPGFKAFVRYRNEDDLYVASWRMDGVVQIQRKQCGLYTALAIRRDILPPTPHAWHTLRFAAVGDQLTLTLDGAQVMTVTDSVFAWGTAGIRIDSMGAAYLDDWKVF